MLSNCGITLLFVIVFGTKFQHGHAIASNRTEVQSKIICTSKWQKLSLAWTFTVANLPPTQNIDSFWSEYGAEFKNQTIKRLHHAVIYAHNFTKNFLCYGNIASLGGLNDTVTFHVQLPKIGSELIGVRLIRLPGNANQRRLEFYLRSPATISKVEYSLHYCAVPTVVDVLIPNEKTCPHRQIINFNCAWRENDVFGIPDSAGFICQGVTSKYIHIHSKYKFRIRTIAHDNFTSMSNDFMLETREIPDGGPVPQYASQGFFIVLERTRKLRYLIATRTLKVNLVTKHS